MKPIYVVQKYSNFLQGAGHHLRMNFLTVNVHTSERQSSMTFKAAWMPAWGGQTAQHSTTKL